MKIASTTLFILFLAYVFSRAIGHTFGVPWHALLATTCVVAAAIVVRRARPR